MTAQEWSDIKAEYSHFLQTVNETEADTELDTWRHTFNDKMFAAEVDTLQAVTKITEHLYQNLHVMFKFF